MHVMWLIQQQSAPDDFVIATGETWTIRILSKRPLVTHAEFDLEW